MAHHLKLVSFDICPYVERSRIVLLEKGLPHEVELIELSNKPAWFLEVSPMGRVPVLLLDSRPVFESMVINELLNELQPEPPLFPQPSPGRRGAAGSSSRTTCSCRRRRSPPIWMPNRGASMRSARRRS